MIRKAASLLVRILSRCRPIRSQVVACSASRGSTVRLRQYANRTRLAARSKPNPVDHGAFIALNYAACHGDQGVSPSGLIPRHVMGRTPRRSGLPALRGQDTAYIERLLAAFAQGTRENDINEQMRVIAHELTAHEMHVAAVYYGTADRHE
jgi:cytochrome c553